MSDEIRLHEGRAAPELDTDEPEWLPELALQHQGTELYVIVGEEAAGMAEGVPAEVFEQVAERWRVATKLLRCVEYVKASGGGGIGFRYDEEDDDWHLAAEFGREAPDSPMAGGASYGHGVTLEECLDTMLKETRA